LVLLPWVFMGLLRDEKVVGDGTSAFFVPLQQQESGARNGHFSKW
jgi:hypothetical protein